MRYSKLGVLSILFLVGLLGCANTKFGASSGPSKRAQIDLDVAAELQVFDENGDRVSSCSVKPTQKLCNATDDGSHIPPITIELHSGKTSYRSNCCLWGYVISSAGKYPVCLVAC